MCDFVHAREQLVRYHRESVHYGVRYQCYLCPTLYANIYYLRSHVINHHGVEGHLPISCRIIVPELATHPAPPFQESNNLDVDDKRAAFLMADPLTPPPTDHNDEMDDTLLVPLAKRPKLDNNMLVTEMRK